MLLKVVGSERTFVLRIARRNEASKFEATHLNLLIMFINLFLLTDLTFLKKGCVILIFVFGFWG